MDDSESSPSPPEVSGTRRREHDTQRRGHRYSKDRDRLFMGGSMRELARLLVYQEHDTKDIRKMFADVTQQLKAETLRADTAEGMAREAALRLKSANDAKVVAQQEAARANEELRLYKLQLDNAQREINRAQQIIDMVEAQRAEAEEVAARARTTARKLKEEKVVQLAREEGRRQGLEEGLSRGRSIGFEEGRAEGYARGSAAAARSRRSYSDDILESPVYERRHRRDTPSGPSGSSPGGYDSRPQSTYSRTVEQNTSASRPVTMPASATEPQSVKAATPLVVHNAAVSPSHPPVDFPPDGWIPKIDGDDRIRLPPPHELAPPPPTTPSPPSTVPLQNVPLQDAVDDRPPLMIPPPSAGDYGESAMSDSDSMTTPTHHRPRHRRRRSSESQSTTMSQFEILGPPITPAPRGVARERPVVLSSIAEERERTSTMSSPAPGHGASPYMPSTGSTFFMPLGRPPSQPSTMDMRSDDGGRGLPRNIYMRPAHSPNSSPESGHAADPGMTLRPPSQQEGSRTSSISAEYDIQIEPPSGPESEQSRSGSAPMTPHLLSAEDVPPLPTAHGPPGSQQQGTSGVSPPSPVPIVLPDSQLPPGFQPIGPPVAASSFGPMAGVQPPMGMASQGIYSMGPAGVPLPPSTYGGTPSVVGSAVTPGPFRATEPVIPHLMTPGTGGLAGIQPGNRYSRSALRDSSSDSDASSGMGGSMDSLTTPPTRRKDNSRQSTPAYAVAPIPPNVTYPVPPTPRSTSSRSTAARVPLPPSTVPSMASPVSTAAYPYGQTPYNRSNPALDAGRTPMNRPMSPMTSSVRGTPAPVQVEPRNSIYDLRSRNAEDDVTRYNTTANAGPPRPPSAPRMSAVGSPSVSQVSLAPTNATSKSKKSKKSKKAKSRIASVEEAADED